MHKRFEGLHFYMVLHSVLERKEVVVLMKPAVTSHS